MRIICDTHIPLFWANLRADVARRERAWFARHVPAKAP